MFKMATGERSNAINAVERVKSATERKATRVLRFAWWKVRVDGLQRIEIQPFRYGGRSGLFVQLGHVFRCGDRQIRIRAS